MAEFSALQALLRAINNRELPEEETVADKLLTRLKSEQFLGHSWIERQARLEGGRLVIDKPPRKIFEFKDNSALVVEIKGQRVFMSSDHHEVEV